ncbi:hypothetical protein K457DRAFT_156544 [Linnemannia elongata AG-77]|uniref:MIT domain-containing protein n=1 Tax=Linnemannia elongata AG-77 TaxID=1314771 RepID=A0A197JRR5_9FUNG|nr:hypothetical protein K457DRAFT_156544 [Linnemannia elongata AG-77]
MSPAPASRSRRSATVAATAPSSSSAYHSNPSGPPPPPPSNHPNQSVQAYSSQQIQIQLPNQLPPRPDYNSYDSDSQQQLQHSYSESNLYSQQQQPQQPPAQTTQQQPQQQEKWSEYNWRNIFDAALVKAQQAVQLDELGETVLATQLYAQAANDLGRVIPLCGSEKKKQSMLTIQAIYLDRVQQLKTAAKANAASKKASAPAPALASAPQVPEEDTRYNQQRTMAYQQQQQEDHHQHQYHHQQQQQQQQQYPAQEYYLPQPSYQPSPEQYHLVQDHYQQQLQQQHPYQPPPPHTPSFGPQTSEKEKESGGFKIFGKKKSKTQMDDHSQQQQQQQLPMQDNNYNYATYNDYNSNINGGYISPPYSEPQKATGSPATLVTPVFMNQTQTPSPTPPIASNNNNSPAIETPPTEQSTKSSRWKPFGKKKSKSFSAGETSSGPYRPPNDYEIPAPPLPLGAQQQHQHLVDPGDHADAYSQQQHADWFVGNDDGPMPMDEYEQHTRYYDEDEDEDVDPYYIADNRGRAQAYEGKDAGKQPSLNNAPSKEPVLKESRKKPTLNHKASSYSNEQSFTPTFGPSGGNGAAYSEEPVVYHQVNEAMTDEQMFTAAFDDGYDYDDNQQSQFDGQYQQQQQQGQYSQQQGASFEPTTLMQHQHPQYSHDPSLQPVTIEAEAEPEEKSSTKNKWFGKKNKKKDPSAESYEDVAKRMDEALFGGGGSSSRKKDKNKDKNKDKKSEAAVESTVVPAQLPLQPHMSGLRTSTLPPPRKASLDYDIRQFSFERSASLDVGFMGENQHQQQQQQQQHYFTEESQPQSLHYQQYHTSSSTANIIAAPMGLPSDELYPPGPLLTQAPSTPKALMPVNYAPKTTYEPKTVYTPSSKKPLPQAEELISEPAQLPSSLGLDLGATFQQQQQQQLQQQQQQHGAAGSIHSQDDGSLLSPDSTKKAKSRPFNLFKSKKNNSKVSLEDSSPLSPTFVANDDSKSTHSDKTRKSSIQSNDRKAIDAAAAGAYSKNGGKKRESDEYVPYEYQEEVEGPLMERVAVREDRDIIGFVLPVEEIIDYTAEGTDEAAALENWDSWVNQLESFEKVLADKGMKKDKGKKSKKAAKKAAKEEAAAAAAASALASPLTPTSPMGSLKANRSSIFSSGVSEHRPMSVSDESTRTSMYSTRSSAIFGAELMSVQQAKRRWWNPKRKEATSVYSVSDSFSVSEQDQEKYLASLLQNNQDAPPLSPSSSTDPRALQSQPDQHQRVTTADVLAVMAAAEERENRERQEALNALLETDGTNRGGASLSLPLPQVGSMTSSTISSTISTQELTPVESSEIVVASVVPVTAKSTNVERDESAAAETQAAAEGEEGEFEDVAPMPPKVVKAKAKSTKAKLLPISTPLAQILKIQNPEELWLYVQQAKTYATTRMNKGDKRSAAIALKRAQALEARWQEIMLELASSEEDDDELLDDDDDEDDEEEESEGEEEEEPEVKVVPKSKAKTVAVTPLVVNTSNKKTTLAAKEAVKVEEELEQQAKSLAAPASTKVITAHPVEEEGEGEDADEERRRLHLRKVTSRSDSASDMFSKYKVNKSAGGSSKNTLAVSSEEAAEDDDAADTDGDEDEGDESEAESGEKKGRGKGSNKSLSSIHDSRLGADASLEQMLETTDVENLKFYIQRMKSDTVAKARSGSKFAALEGMKNVKVLQQRLAELEEGDGEEEEKKGGAEGGEQVETAAA